MKPLAAFVLLVLAGTAQAQPRGFTWEEVPADVRSEVRTVVEDPTARSAVEHRRVVCAPRTYRHLLDHLPLAAVLLDALELEGGEYTITDAPDDGFTIDDRNGARADCARLAAEPGRLLVIARGSIDLGVTTVEGTGVIAVRYEEVEEGRGLRCSIHVDFRLNGRWLRALTSPLRRALDRALSDKLEALITSATHLPEAIERDTVGVYQALARLRGVDRERLLDYRAGFLSR